MVPKNDWHDTVKWHIIHKFNLKVHALHGWRQIANLNHWDGNWSYRSSIMADAEAAEKGWLFQTVVF